MREFSGLMAVLGAGAMCVGACGGDDGQTDLFGTSDGTSTASDGSAGTTASGTGTATTTATDGDTGDGSTDDGADDGTTDDGDDGVKLDIGEDTDMPPTCEGPDAECGCNAVDILFVVDNSGSMQTHAPAVIAAFDTFVEEMVGALPNETNLHVGVTRGTGFFNPGNSGGWGGGTCEGFSDGTWNPPDVMDSGINGQQGRLFEHAGLRYFDHETSQASDPLKTWFQGALMGAIQGDQASNSETVVAGAAYPFHPANDAFNAGFMREQSVLVIFLMSDSPDLSPANVPTSDFITMVSDAKAACGDMCILTTGAIAGGCYGDPANTNTRLYDFMNGFGSAPASFVEFSAQQTPDFTGVLGTTLSQVIATTCENIPPVD